MREAVKSQGNEEGEAEGQKLIARVSQKEIRPKRNSTWMEQLRNCYKKGYLINNFSYCITTLHFSQTLDNNCFC